MPINVAAKAEFANKRKDGDIENLMEDHKIYLRHCK
jgi:hypothetical protein